MTIPNFVGLGTHPPGPRSTRRLIVWDHILSWIIVCVEWLTLKPKRVFGRPIVLFMMLFMAFYDTAWFLFSVLSSLESRWTTRKQLPTTKFREVQFFIWSWLLEADSLVNQVSILNLIFKTFKLLNSQQFGSILYNIWVWKSKSGTAAQKWQFFRFQHKNGRLAQNSEYQYVRP